MNLLNFRSAFGLTIATLFMKIPQDLPFPDRFFPDPEKTKNLRVLCTFAVQ
jgi:hypothetical protein